MTGNKGANRRKVRCNVSKENAEKFCSILQQHKAIAKKLADLSNQGEEVLLQGLLPLAKEMGLECTSSELRDELETPPEELLASLAGGMGHGGRPRDVPIPPSFDAPHTYPDPRCPPGT